MTTKRFPTIAVMGLYTGVLYEDGGFRDIMAVASFLVGESVFLHDMGRIAKECHHYLLDWYPWLESAMIASRASNDWKGIATTYTTLYGDTLELWQIPQDDHISLDPITSAKLLGVDEDKILRLDIDSED